MIIASAVKLSNQKVYTGERHGNCYAKIKFLGLSIESCKNSIQGFITDDLTFLDREAGYHHAFRNKQCEEDVYTEAEHPDLKISKDKWKPQLHSEDLW